MWSRLRRMTLIVGLVAILTPPRAFSQDAVPPEMLSRTMFIKFGNETGTAFSIDHDGKMYLVTARHIVAGVPKRDATIQVWQERQWKDYRTVRTLLPSSEEIDIAVFETNNKVEKPYWVRVPGVGVGGPTLGQQVWFIGYPYGLSSRVSNGDYAFVKRGTMSAIDASNQEATVFYIDGFNNPGFSGGPIIYWDFATRTYRILGVVQGYRKDSAKLLINGQQLDTQFLVNTGIVVGYSIEHAMKIIKESKQAEQAK